jgi:hypothetical protein
VRRAGGRRLVALAAALVTGSVLAWAVAMVLATDGARDRLESDAQVLDTQDPGTPASGAGAAGTSAVTTADTAASASMPTLPSAPVQALQSGTPWLDEAEPAGHGSLLLRATWGAAGAPAPGVALDVTAWGDPDRARRTRRVRTLESGAWHDSGVAAGIVTVEAVRGGKASGTVRPDEETVLVVVLDIDLYVTGVVRDPGGRPVPGADVLVSLLGAASPSEPRVAARADADGRFELRHLAAGQAVRAQGRTREASPAIVLEDNEQHALDLVLELGPPGTALRGLVLDASGWPRERADVRVTTLHAGSHPPRQEHTDAQGRFSVEGLPAEPLLVHASTSDRASTSRVVDLSEGAVPELRLVLQPPASLAGTVQDGAGRPVDGALVWILAEPSISQQRARDGGRYAFDAVEAGNVQVLAWHRTGGLAATTLPIEEGEQRIWTATLEPGASIRGRVLHEDGVVPEELHVVAVPIDHPLAWRMQQLVSLDADGRFEIRNCLVARHALRVQQGRVPEPLLTRHDVQPGAGEVLITLPRALLRSASVAGLLLADDPKLLSGARVVLVREAQAALDAQEDLDGEAELDAEVEAEAERRVADDGTFLVDLLAPGAYAVLLWTKSGARWPLADVTLAENQQLVLAPIQLPQGGGLRVQLELPVGVLQDDVRVHIAPRPTSGARVRPGDFDVPIVRGSGEPLDRSGLAPGQHVLLVEGQGIAPSSRVVAIEPGRTTVETVRPGVGIPARFTVTISAGRLRTVSSQAWVELYDGAGLPMGWWRHLGPLREAGPGRVSLGDHIARLVPGAYSARVTLDDDAEFERDVRIESAGGAVATVTLALP